MLLPLLQNNLQTVATATEPPVVAVEIPSYATKRIIKRDGRDYLGRRFTDAPKPVEKAVVKPIAAAIEPAPQAPAKDNEASRQAMRRSVQAATQAAQLQALADLREQLIASQAEAERAWMADEEDAIALLMLL